MKEAAPKTERQHHHNLLTRGLMPYMLEQYNSNVAAFSLEQRFPFQDKRLLEFCLSLPPTQKLHDGWNRMVMRRAMNGILPEEVRWRGGKTDMSPMFRYVLRSFESDRLERVIVNNPDKLTKYYNITNLRKAYDRFILNDSNNDSMTVWKAVTLAGWLENAGIKS